MRNVLHRNFIQPYNNLVLTAKLFQDNVRDEIVSGRGQ